MCRIVKKAPKSTRESQVLKNFSSESAIFHVVARAEQLRYNVPMENIFKLSREGLGLSQAKLAQLSGVSKAAIIRTEQGLYPAPSPNLLKALDLKYETTIPAYLAFQTNKRVSSGPHGRPPFFSPNDFFSVGMLPLTQHPMTWMLNGRSILDFCKAFCLKPDLVTKWINKPHLVVTVPGPVLEALSIAGFPERQIVQLSHAYRRYRAHYIDMQRWDNNLKRSGGVA